MKNKVFSLGLALMSLSLFAKDEQQYKKRVLENTEVEIMMNYYQQDGDNAATTGGIGSEELYDFNPEIKIAIPLNDDDIIEAKFSISAYSSASSSNVNPFDNGYKASPFSTSSGASKSDLWGNFTGSYTHYSDDRDEIFSGSLSFSTEFDYKSIGASGSFTQLFNQKNTELSFKAGVFIDWWTEIYPFEMSEHNTSTSYEYNAPPKNPITGETFEQELQASGYQRPTNYEHDDLGRNTYNLGLSLSQILSQELNFQYSADFTLQDGLLSTPFHRIYYKDVKDVKLRGFTLSEGIETLPSSRFKVANGMRLNYFLSESLIVRTFYRFYWDDWGVKSHTAQIELPLILNDEYRLYPMYRFYNQTAVDYFAPFNQHLSTEKYHTSDFDLSEFKSHYFGIGLRYTDIFAENKVWQLGLKSWGVKFGYYDRDSSFDAFVVSLGTKFVWE